MSDGPNVTGPYRSVSGPHLLISVPPPIKSVLIVGSGMMRLECHEPPPNLWRRFWYWLLLDWRWEKRP